MVRLLPLTALALLVGATLLLTGCGCTSCDSGPVGVAPPVDTVMKNFVLHDVNPNSFTYQAPDSPRTHVGHISAWYFGSAT